MSDKKVIHTETRDRYQEHLYTKGRSVELGELVQAEFFSQTTTSPLHKKLNREVFIATQVVTTRKLFNKIKK